MYYNALDPLNQQMLQTDQQWQSHEMQNLSPEELFEVGLRNACYGCVTTLFAFIIGIVLVLLFGSCTTTRLVPVEHITHDTIQITRLQRDSIYRHDSIRVVERVQGDTLLLEVDRWHTQYRDRWHHDSIYVTRCDTIPKPYPVERLVEKPLTSWQKARLWLANIVLAALATSASVWLFRRRRFWKLP